MKAKRRRKREAQFPFITSISIGMSPSSSSGLPWERAKFLLRSGDLCQVVCALGLNPKSKSTSSPQESLFSSLKPRFSISQVEIGRKLRLKSLSPPAHPHPITNIRLLIHLKSKWRRIFIMDSQLTLITWYFKR